jgi:phosphopantothenoylcysteine decarboxylase
MARIVLGVTGSVAAVRTPDLVAELLRAGHELSVAPTEPSLSFFPIDALVRSHANISVYRDRDEWPSAGYRRGDPVLHIELRRWADLLVVAPLDAHTMAKFALGLCDNLLTCLFRAWDFSRPVVLAPAMNTLMWTNPVTRRTLRALLEDHSGRSLELNNVDEAAALFARHAPRIILIPPQTKQLACGDIGTGAMAEVLAIAEAVRIWTTADDHSAA